MPISITFIFVIRKTLPFVSVQLVPGRLCLFTLTSPEQRIASDVPEMSLMKAPYIDVEAAEERTRNKQKSWSWEPVNLPPGKISKD